MIAAFTLKHSTILVGPFQHHLSLASFVIKLRFHFVVYFKTLGCASFSSTLCCFILRLRLTCNLNIIISNSCKVFVGLFLLSQIPFCICQLVVLFSVLHGSMDTKFLPNSKKSRKMNNDVGQIGICFCLECFLLCIHHRCLCIERPKSFTSIDLFCKNLLQSK